jgi:hypothetical protein
MFALGLDFDIEPAFTLARSQRFASTRIPSCRSGIAVRAAERWFTASVDRMAGR